MDYTGKRYGKITLLRYSRPGGKGVGSYWIGQCDCGSRKEYIARYLTAGRMKTCGNCVEYRKLRVSERRQIAAQRRRMALETKRAHWQGESWGLSPQAFYQLIQRPCWLCGETEIRGVAPMVRGGGITLENAAAECAECRARRGSASGEELLAYCLRVAKPLLDRRAEAVVESV